MRYPVTLTRDDNHTIMATFPDVPGAITYGATKEEALKRAPDALLTIFDALMKDRRDIPDPSPARGVAVEVPSIDVAKIMLYRAMREGHVTKAELGRRLDVHGPQVDRLLEMTHASKLDQIEAAFRALGKRLVVAVEDLAAPAVRHDRKAAPVRRMGRRARA